MEGEESKQWNLKYVKRTLETYAKIKVSLEDYCKMSEQALIAPDSILLQQQKTYKSQAKRGQNYGNLVAFLLNPAINLTPRGRYQTKKELDIIETGKRIVGTITYAWDYYIRLLKGVQDSNNKMNMVYNKENLESAKNNIKGMMKELKDKRYWWENYEKNELSFQEEQIKDVTEEETFVKLLDNMLKNQIQKVAVARISQQKSEIKQQENRIQNDDKAKQLKEVKQTDNNTSESTIDFRAYFLAKKQKITINQFDDPISQEEDRRRFNAAVLRYCSNTRID